MTEPGTISRDELQQKIARREEFFLFEVLPEPYYRKHHLPGALHMPPNDVKATIERVAPNRDAQIVTYCWDDH
ncbi:MAG TPA: rhodanese-like domain-containing protein [Gemmatimonadaceae bacterium]|nr:rhodanese-like domain-containing protein [Gemmatimonadaceae bacterium]